MKANARTIDREVLASLIEWLAWHAATEKEINDSPKRCHPFLHAMGRASGVAKITPIIEALETVLDDTQNEPGQHIGNVACPSCGALIGVEYGDEDGQLATIFPADGQG